MRYVQDRIELRKDEAAQVTGNATLYTVQNIGQTAAAFLVSNDAVNWFELGQVPAGEIKNFEHSAAYIKTTEPVIVTRGENKIVVE